MITPIIIAAIISKGTKYCSKLLRNDAGFTEGSSSDSGIMNFTRSSGVFDLKVSIVEYESPYSCCHTSWIGTDGLELNISISVD